MRSTLVFPVLFGLLVTQPDPPSVVTVTGFDYAFTAPDTIASGATTFRFIDQGKVDHHLVIFRLDSKISLGDFHRVMSSGGASPPGIASLGGLQTDKIYRRIKGTDPAGEKRARGLTVVLRPGRYVLACLHTEDGVSHLAKGMMRELTVIPSKQPARSPRADATLSMSDYRYRLSRPLTAGTRTIRIVNHGPQEHHVFIQRMRPGKKLADIAAHRAARSRERASGVPDSQSVLVPPMIPFSAITRMSPGEEVFLTLALAAGDYRLFCIMSDAWDGEPHTRHGMDQLIAVR